MKIKTNIKSGGLSNNHNQTMARAAGLKIRTSIKAGGFTSNHNQTCARDMKAWAGPFSLSLGERAGVRASHLSAG